MVCGQCLSVGRWIVCCVVWVGFRSHCLGHVRRATVSETSLRQDFFFLKTIVAIAVMEPPKRNHRLGSLLSCVVLCVFQLKLALTGGRTFKLSPCLINKLCTCRCTGVA